jgi:hypothetical protein
MKLHKMKPSAISRGLELRSPRNRSSRRVECASRLALAGAVKLRNKGLRNVLGRSAEFLRLQHFTHNLAALVYDHPVH